MTCAEAAKEYVATLTPVTALVGGRIWTFRFPQKPTLPAVLFQQIGDVQFGHLRGTARLKRARVQVDCLAVETSIAGSIRSARALDQAVMGDYVAGVAMGLLGATATVGGSPGIRMIVEPVTAGYREDYAAEELKQARTMRDYMVWIESV